MSFAARLLRLTTKPAAGLQRYATRPLARSINSLTWKRNWNLNGKYIKSYNLCT